MKNILLPTDFSENSLNAITYVINAFESYECTFFLLHVSRLNNFVEGNTPYVPTQDIIDTLYAKPAKKRLKEVLKKIAQEQPNNKNHKFYTLTDYNFFIESIRKQVKEKNIDLIAMGTKGASGLKEYIIGSNTGDVITKVKCSTMVVPENAVYAPLNEVAFPTDFTATYDFKTLQPILDILDKSHASLRIVHINKKDEPLNIDQQTNKNLLDDFFENSEYSYHFLTHKKVEDAVQCFVESRAIDMIVMIAKNLNYFQQILFHSKVEKISYHTNIPFLVLHE